MNRKWYEMKRWWFAAIILIVLAFSDLNEPSRTESIESASNHLDTPLPEFTVTKSIQEPERQNCHTSYSGCLSPYASDYDCAGGSGNGPYYTESVRVIGPDVFDLDRDGDGWGCE